MQTHTCPQCKKTKPITEFYPRWLEKYKKYYYCWCKSCTEYNCKKRYQLNRGEKLAYARKYRKNNPEKYRQILQKSSQKLRINVLSHYGGNPPKCICCNETEIKFLAIDHIDGGGHQHNIKLRRWGGSFYRWLKNNNYPSGFQILCHNCNMAKGFYGKCPHQK